MQGFIDESGLLIFLFIYFFFFFAFHAEIQDSRQKWRENNLCEKLPADSENTLRIKNFVEIALSRSVSEINAFLRFQRKEKS